MSTHVSTIPVVRDEWRTNTLNDPEFWRDGVCRGFVKMTFGFWNMHGGTHSFEKDGETAKICLRAAVDAVDILITLEEKLARAGDNSGRGIVQTHMEPLGPVACTRCAELETELEADRATLDDTREEIEDYKAAMVMVSAALRCESDDIQTVVQAADDACGELARLRDYRVRVESASRLSRGAR